MYVKPCKDKTIITALICWPVDHQQPVSQQVTWLDHPVGSQLYGLGGAMGSGGNVTQREFQADLGHWKSKCAANAYQIVCVCLCGPSVLARLLESDKKSDGTRLEFENRAWERGKNRWERRKTEENVNKKPLQRGFRFRSPQWNAHEVILCVSCVRYAGSI